MICLRFRTFAVPATTPRIFQRVQNSCDLLEISYFCSTSNNAIGWWLQRNSVVICLRFRTFAVPATTMKADNFGRLGCDLLEISYFCSTSNNHRTQCLAWQLLWFAWDFVLLQYQQQLIDNLLYNHLVVICLRFRTFAVPATTSRSYVRSFLSCDLLEISYFCSTSNNGNVENIDHVTVVICLRFRTFAVPATTH